MSLSKIVRTAVPDFAYITAQKHRVLSKSMQKNDKLDIESMNTITQHYLISTKQ